MNSKVFLILRIVFGLFLLTFGANKFLHFMPFGEMSEAGMAYFTALVSTKTVVMVGIIEIISALALLTNKYGALMMLILMSISVNAVLFHATLEPASIGGALGLLVLNIVMLYGYKDKYKDLLQG
ncbi:DoxX family protein [Spongiimicrobium sp. 3-5]|uniref:DoxX family protein n=1 Tax=Spongiimicrobium sp. 3-5 TaxID=3332596 RepID=UPI003980E0ED